MLDTPFFKTRTMRIWHATAGPTEDGANIDAELQPYLDGSKQPPIPAYFIGAYGRNSASAVQQLQQSGEGSPVLRYLGRSGLTSVHGLNVAFLDGTYSSLQYTQGVPEQGSAACRHFTQVGLVISLPCPTSSSGSALHAVHLLLCRSPRTPERKAGWLHVNLHAICAW